MRVFALVPIKAPRLGKSRLSAVLRDAERRRLNMDLAAQTLASCCAAFGAERAVVVTDCVQIAEMAAARSVPVVREGERPAGLNSALALAAGHAVRAGGEAILVVPADLPRVSAERLKAVAATLPAAPGCVLVPDRRREGTNLLGLSPVRRDVFCFGADSFRRHADAARAMGYRVHVHESAELELDLDLPEDLDAWAANARPASAI
ncbi:MAG: 2-phospho-L-lactate guanylyltransferase [Burkholderiales bacterium]